MVDSPSLVGRAPVPPLWIGSVANTVALPLTATLAALRSETSHRHAVPSAGTRPGRALCRQPNITSGSVWPIMWRIATGAGSWALTMQPAGATTRIGSSEPALFGISGPTMQRMPNTE